MSQISTFPAWPRPAGLLVDDEELARLRLKSLVGECGEPRAIVVGEAANAAQALVWLATRSCDLLLLDVQMPGRDAPSSPPSCACARRRRRWCSSPRTPSTRSRRSSSRPSTT